MRFLPYLLLPLLIACGGGGGSSAPTYTGPYLGTDFFTITNNGLPSTLCDRILRVFNGIEAPALGFIWGSFGDNYACAERFIAENADKPHLVRIHLDDHVCKRNRNCVSSEFNSGLTVSQLNTLLEKREGWLLHRYRSRIASIHAWAVAVTQPTTRFVISGGLEEQMSVGAAEVVASLLREFNFETVANPVRVEQRSTYDFLEIHTSVPKRDECIAALDGYDIDFPHKMSFFPRILPTVELCDWMRKNTSCLGIFLWSARSQGLGLSSSFAIPGSAGYVPPRERNIDFSEEDASYMNLLLLSAQRSDFTCAF